VTTGAWNKLAPIPTPRHTLGVAVVNNTELFFVGGQDNNWQLLNAVEIYNPLSDTWKRSTPLPTPRYGLGVAYHNGKVYVIGGETTMMSDLVEVFDIETNKWISGYPNMTTPRGYFAGVVVVGDLIYCIGGKDYDDYALTTNEAYDTVANKWVRKAPLPSGVMFSASVVTSTNDAIYVLGGGGDIFAPISTVYKYTVATDSWQNVAPLETGKRIRHSAVTANGHVYVIGGEVNNAISNSIEVYI